MQSESVKGSLVLGAVVATRRVCERRGIEPESIQARLSAEALELLGRKIEVARWYPIGAFCELIQLCWETEGKRDPAYLEQQGAVSADRLFESGRYQQLEFAERSGKVDTRAQLIRHSKLIATVTSAFYNFLEIDVDLEPTGLSIVYGNAAAFAEPLVHTTVGFMNQINVRQGSNRHWSGERVQPDEVRFHMVLPVRLVGTD